MNIKNKVTKLENVIAMKNENDVPPYPELELFFSEEPGAKDRIDEMISKRESWLQIHPYHKGQKLEDFII